MLGGHSALIATQARDPKKSKEPPQWVSWKEGSWSEFILILPILPYNF